MLALTTLGSTIGLAAWNGGAVATGGSTSGGSNTAGSTTASCRCPATSRRTGKRVCNCPFDDNCDTTACYNPGGGKIPGQCPHNCGFG